MRENVDESEFDEPGVSGINNGTREDLKSIAKYQKGILLCILANVMAVATQFVLPPELRPFLGLAILGVGVVATVFVFLLSTKVYNIGLGIVLGILTLVPLLGMIILLIINSKATVILRKNGVHVGFLGANVSDI